MTSPIAYTEPLIREHVRVIPRFWQKTVDTGLQADPNLPVSITKSASKQTYYTIKYFVDHQRVTDAYRAYAYFRWVDDILDQELSNPAERMDFLNSEQALVDSSYRHQWRCNLSPEERILTDLIASDNEPYSGLQAYIRNMMAVMSFDAQRRGRLITQRELGQYSKQLATAVTEALHYFIGHDDGTPHTPPRYLAVTAAHITHLLRDTYEDVAAGYFNIPVEFLNAHHLDPADFSSEHYRTWVKHRVQVARGYFEQGKRYIARVKNLRTRIAGYAYISRFETVLNLIEKDDYQLRADYSDRKSLCSGLNMGRSLLSMLVTDFLGEIS
jgi:phytoene/squalene synthetase